MKEVWAICKKTYPDENDMIDWYNSEIELDNIKIYYKGEKYLVNEQANKEYFEIIKDDKDA